MDDKVRQFKDTLAPAHHDRAPEHQQTVHAGQPAAGKARVAPPPDMLVNIIAELLSGRSDAASILAAAAVRLTPAASPVPATQGLSFNIKTRICLKWQLLRRQNRC